MRDTPLILIVDDDLSGLDILQARLSTQHYDFLSATDGEMALAMVKDRKPDLILLDVIMPKIDGIEVCKRVKSDPNLPFIPIIMVTAKDDSRDIVAGLDAGADEYLTKPYSHSALVARVKSMLRIKSLHDQVLDQSAQLERQLKTATIIQSLFWPKIPALTGGGHVWAVSVPAGYVGGDLYDVIPLSDGSLVAYVADISGKGVPAALLMTALSTTFRSKIQIETEIDRLLESVNDSMHRLMADESYFATAVLIRYWPSSGKLQYALAGHLQPLWIVDGNIPDLPLSGGMPLGIQKDAKYQKEDIVLGNGQSILLFTDGLIEAENESGEQFTNSRLAYHLKTCEGPPWGKSVLQRIEAWRGRRAANDDLTIMEVWRDPAQIGPGYDI
ncbi:MAG: PP2C family protein-serine/threonine phosphatase [Desulfobacterales bacterium]